MLRNRWTAPFALALVLSMVLTAPVVADQSWSFSGTLAAGPTYERAEEDFSPSANQVYYHVQVFRVPESGPCAVYSAQDFDGFLSLYEGAFDPVEPTANLVAADDDGELGGLTSKLGPLVLQPGIQYHLVTSSYMPLATGGFETTIQCDAELRDGHIVQGRCADRVDGTESCLLDGRFKVSVKWKRRNGGTARAKVAPFSSEQAALFYFAGASNWDVMAKLADGCRRNGHVGVSVASLASAAHTVTVTDTHTGAVRTYPVAGGKGTTNDPKAFRCE